METYNGKFFTKKLKCLKKFPKNWIFLDQTSQNYCSGFPYKPNLNRQTKGKKQPEKND